MKSVFVFYKKKYLQCHLFQYALMHSDDEHSFLLDFATIVPNEKRYQEKSPHISL